MGAHYKAMAATAIGRELMNLVLPVACAGCGENDTMLCGHCRATPARCHQPQLTWTEALWGVPVWAGCDYEGSWRRIIVAWKERGVFSLAPALARVTAEAWRRVDTGGHLVIVPVPGSWSGWFRRGVEPTRQLAHHLLRLLPTEVATRVQISRRLRRGAIWSQGLIGAPSWRRKQRGRNERLARPPRFRARGMAACEVVLIDDVVTTGATLEQAAKVLQQAGARVVGVVVCASRAG